MSKYISADKAPLFLMNRTINKMSTGCGVTTMLIRDSFNRVIVNPNRAIVDSKSKEDCFCVRAGITVTQVANYLSSLNGKPIKIMTTAASFHKVIEGFKKAFNNYYDIISITALTIDESELAVYPLYAKHYAAIYETKHWWFAFNEVSATPINNCEVNLTEFDYDFNYIHIPDLSLNRFAGDVKVLLDNNKEVFCFVNSVKVIKAILSKLSLSVSDVNIYCGIGELNDVKLSPYVIDGSNINSKITFCTSAAYRGVDLFSLSKDSVNCVTICYSGNGYMALDWSILVQIAGRVRNHNITPIVCGMLCNRSLDQIKSDLLSARDRISELNSKSLVIPDDLQWATVYGTTRFNQWYLDKVISIGNNIYNKTINRIVAKRKTVCSVDLNINSDECFIDCFTKVYNRYSSTIVNVPIDHLCYTESIDYSLDDSLYGKIAQWCVSNNISADTVINQFLSYDKHIKGVLSLLSKLGCTESWCTTSKDKNKKVGYEYKNVIYSSKKEIGDKFNLTTTQLDSLTRKKEITKVNLK